jgi:hypothetical protein
MTAEAARHHQPTEAGVVKCLDVFIYKAALPVRLVGVTFKDRTNARGAIDQFRRAGLRSFLLFGSWRAIIFSSPGEGTLKVTHR